MAELLQQLPDTDEYCVERPTQESVYGPPLVHAGYLIEPQFGSWVLTRMPAGGGEPIVYDEHPDGQFEHRRVPGVRFRQRAT